MPESAWVPVHVVSSESELAVVKSLFDAAEIGYQVHNDRFGSLWPGPRIPLFNEQIVLVAAADADRARELLGSATATGDDPRSVAGSSGREARSRLRMILEAFLFGWFIPARRQRSRESTRGASETERDR